MTTDKAALQVSRSAVPNLTPFTVQLVSSGELGALRSTITPMNGLQLGEKAFTAFAIAVSSTLSSIGSRLWDACLVLKIGIIVAPMPVGWPN